MEDQEKEELKVVQENANNSRLERAHLTMEDVRVLIPLIITIVASVAAIICISIFSTNLVKAKRGDLGGMTATGSASVDFESDLVVWRGEFSAFDITMKDSYKVIKRDGDLIRKYLEEQGVTAEEMVFSSVDISPSYTTEYNDEGNAVRDVLKGYDLYQSLTVTSSDLDKVESISRDITKLIESDVKFTSFAPEYYYTKLDELKLDLIQKATENAKKRIDIMADGTNANVGRLNNASLGVFQITAKNSGPGEYSYDGSFDTGSRFKTAMITTRLDYEVQ